jgi:hypothetical protein
MFCRDVALFATLSILMTVGFASGIGATLYVPGDYGTISAAVAAANTGDTVRVYAGTYIEHVNVTKSLVLIGSGPDTATTIVAPADFATNSAYNYLLVNFTTERAIVHIGGSAVLTVAMQGFTIDGSRLGPSASEGVAYAGVLAERTVLSFSNNTIQNILPADSSQTYNTTYNGRGISVRGDSCVATISGNTLTEINRYFIFINATDVTANLPAVFPIATISGNTITGKGTYNGAQKGIWLNNGCLGTISGNTITSMDYVDPYIESDRATAITIRRGYLNPGQRNRIINNTLTTGSFVNNKGIFAEGGKDSIAGNTVTGFRFGIQLDDEDSAMVVGNTVSGGQVGVMIATTTIPAVAAYAITIGGTPAARNTITGQDPSSIGAAIALSFRDPVADGTFMSSVPVDARFNDLGVYTESEIRERIWDRADTTLAGVDTVYYYPFYTPKIRASVKVFLQGPYNAGTDLMTNGLKTSGVLAAHFGVTPFPALAIDSITIELRNAVTAAGSTTRLYAAAWLLTDGSIRKFSDTTKSYVEFDTTLSGSYYLVVRHRNHLAIMCSTAQVLDGSTNPVPYDFSTGQGQAYGATPLAAVGTRFAMYCGDVTGNGQLKYSGSANDRAPILTRVGGTSITATLSGYYPEDVNMNGQVKYSGSANDRAIILTNVGGTSLTATRSTQVP